MIFPDRREENPCHIESAELVVGIPSLNEADSIQHPTVTADQGLRQFFPDLKSVITEGAVDRVRPKLMTVATTMIGLLPVMFGTETGTRVMKRIAAPMVGGLVSSTVLTLVIIPAIYLIWRRWQHRNDFSKKTTPLAPEVSRTGE